MSDTKLKENKQVLNEWVLGGFIMIGLTALALWALRKADFTKVIGKDGASGLSAEVYNAIPNLYTDKDFVKDFVKILQQESNLEDIIEKSQTQWYALKNKNRTGPKYRDTFFDQEDYQELIKGNIKGYGFQPDAKRIAQNVIKSNGYKKFSKKHKFKAGDNRDMVGIIYYIITRNDFAETAKKYLYAAASDNKNISIPPLPKGAFDRAAGA
jgi:hypothetical protein